MKTLTLLVSMLALSGCAINNTLKESSAVQQYATPSSLPVSAVTDFTSSIQCMDNYLDRYNGAKIRVVIMEEQDTTGTVVGAKDMLITALSKMARKSNSISVSAVNAGDGDRFVRELAENVLEGADVNVDSPKYYIRVSQPQIDESVATDQMQAGLRLVDLLDGTLARDTLMSAMSLDMNMGKTTSLENIPGVYSSNTVAIKRSGDSIGTSGTVKKLGVIFRVTTDRAEGFHHTMRQLVELGSIELIGRLTHIPYWECLDIAASNKAVQRQIEDWFEHMSEDEMMRFIQTKLSAQGYYGGEIDGKDNTITRNAIAAFKGNVGLLATSDADIALYKQLLTDQTPIAANHIASLNPDRANANTRERYVATNHTTSHFQRVMPLTLKTALNNQPSLSVGEKFSFTAQPSVNSHLYCYYQKPGLPIYKIFPNRYRRDSYVEGGGNVQIPGDHSLFTLNADSLGDRHDILCISSQTDIEKDSYLNLDKVPDLSPITAINNIPINNLAQIFEAYKQASFAKKRAMPVSSFMSTRVQ